jgi:tetratricopeptide (TPR) repeat protein
VAYERNGEFDNALKEYEEASPKLPIAHLYMGNIFFLKKEYKKAEHSYKKMIAEDPRNADAHNNLAWLYYSLRLNLRDAEALARRAMELNPEKKDIYEDTVLKIRAVSEGK